MAPVAPPTGSQIKTNQKKNLSRLFKNERFYCIPSRISYDSQLISYSKYKYTPKNQCH